jgi:serine/threonine protein kinase
MISHYRILSKLGAGGMGEVYLAEDTKLERKVAIKCLPSKSLADEKAKMRLIREAQLAAKLDHPNICSIHEHLEEDNQIFIVMQYIEGEPLSDKIQHRSLTVRESLDVVLQVAEALAEAHSQGIIHRDIKPQNILVTPRGQVKVLDFGLAKFQPGQAAMGKAKTQFVLTEAGAMLGTVRCMSPEQARGLPVDPRSDLFSLGTLLYECLTGKPAFSGGTMLEIGAQVIHVDPPAPSSCNPAVPPEVDDLTLKMLAKEPEARYQSAGELIGALRNLCHTLPTEHEMVVPRTSRGPIELQTRPTATVGRSFSPPGDFPPLSSRPTSPCAAHLIDVAAHGLFPATVPNAQGERCNDRDLATTQNSGFCGDGLANVQPAAERQVSTGGKHFARLNRVKPQATRQTKRR